jgi:hypothetical protein
VNPTAANQQSFRPRDIDPQVAGNAIQKAGALFRKIERERAARLERRIARARGAQE